MVNAASLTMCGRFAQQHEPEHYAADLGAQIRLAGDVPPPRYNVAPSTSVWIARASKGHRELIPLRWGLVPFWVDDPEKGPKPINARAESIAGKPTFRKLIGWRRCIVPVAGFYEWEQTPKGKQPYFIRFIDDKLMYLGGLWDRWKRAEAPVIESFAIITTEPNELAVKFHDRMPLVIGQEDVDRWLDPRLDTPEDVLDLLRPYPADEMVAYPVSRRVNSATNEGADLIAELESGVTRS